MSNPAFHPGWRAGAYGLVFLTGLSGLVFQVVWLRYLSLLSGCDTLAVAVVLAVFLGGMSVGYLIFGRWSVRARRPLRLVAVAEAVIGVWALLFPTCFSLVDRVTAGWSFAPPGAQVLQVAFCAMVLMGVPAACMGATIPLLTKGMSRDAPETERVHARVYGINTLGACVGAFAAGFWLMPKFGLPGTLAIAGACNLVAAGWFWAGGGKTEDGGRKAEDRGQRTEGGGVTRWCWVAALSGFYVLALEGILIRVLGLSIGSSVHAFAVLVAVFVGAIGAGALVAGRLRAVGDRAVFVALAGAACGFLVLFPLLDEIPYWAHVLRVTFQPHAVGFAGFNLAVFAGLAVLVGGPAALAGAVLPMVFARVRRDLGSAGYYSGLLFAWNLAGCLVGSLVGGFLFFEWMDLGRGFLTACLAAAAAAAVAAARLGRAWKLAAGGIVLAGVLMWVVRPGHEPSRFALGTFSIATPLPYSFDGAAEFFRMFNRDRNLVYYRDGTAATVAVIETRSEWLPPEESGPKTTLEDPVPPPVPLSILVNGRSDSNTEADGLTLKMLAHLPALLADSRERVFIVGLGTGVTAGELLHYSDVREIAVAELSKEVAQALPLFSEWTGRVHEEPGFRVEIGDARRILSRGDAARWDVIISEPSNPRVTGVDQLFSVDFYQDARRALAPGGAFVQWMQLYAASPEMLGLMLNSLHKVFPETRFFLGEDSDLLVVARPQGFGPETVAGAGELLRTHPGLERALREIGIGSAEALMEREQRDLREAVRALDFVGLETRDRPRLHAMAAAAHFARATPWGSVENPATGEQVHLSSRLLTYPDQTEPPGLGEFGPVDPPAFSWP